MGEIGMRDDQIGERLGIAQAEVEALAFDVAPVFRCVRIRGRLVPAGHAGNRDVERDREEKREIPVSAEFRPVKEDAVDTDPRGSFPRPCDDAVGDLREEQGPGLGREVYRLRVGLYVAQAVHVAIIHRLMRSVSATRLASTSARSCSVTMPRSGAAHFTSPAGSAKAKPAASLTFAPRWKTSCRRSLSAPPRV